MVCREAGDLVRNILAAQNPDGGWAYTRGTSWTEPTAYALLALGHENSTGEALQRGIAWLRNNQRPDGGWAPQTRVRQSTWVTALALFVLLDQESDVCAKAIDWLLDQSGRESVWTNRFRRWLAREPSERALDVTGWPWYPDTAAWVTPTALTVLAAAKACRRSSQPALAERVERARRYLLARQCADGGWNHGYNRGFGREAPSYPETTGQALLALRGFRTEAVLKAFDRAERQLATCSSVEASCWLRLALAADGRPAALPWPGSEKYRSLPEIALAVLTQGAEHGRYVLAE